MSGGGLRGVSGGAVGGGSLAGGLGRGSLAGGPRRGETGSMGGGAVEAGGIGGRGTGGCGRGLLATRGAGFGFGLSPARNLHPPCLVVSASAGPQPASCTPHAWL